MTIDATSTALPDEGERDVFYRLDASDRIVEVGGNWRPFTDMGGTVSLYLERLIGSNIFDHVSGHFTRVFLRKFIAASRGLGAQTRVLCRCDSPSHKVLTEMRAEPGENGEMLISHRTIDTAPLPFEINLLPTTSYGAGRALRCSMCNRLRMSGCDAWKEPETIVTGNQAIFVVHTVCPDCRHGVKVQPIRGRSGS